MYKLKLVTLPSSSALLFTILLGTHLLQGNSDAVRVATETYFLHPEYNPSTLENDLGIIRFRASVTYSGRVFRIDFSTIVLDNLQLW